jgi:hypothetical protein
MIRPVVSASAPTWYIRERPFNLKGGYGFFLKKYSDFGGGKQNNLIHS